MNLSIRKQSVPRDFDKVAGSYDLMTALNPGYRKHLEMSAARLDVPAGGRVLDLCCGTGLSTEAVVKAHPTARIDGVDASEGMLEVARRKDLGPGVRFSAGNAMDLADAGITGPYDAILMAYGIRNMPDPDACLEGLLEVLAPGGAVCFHEYSVADSPRSKAIWNVVTGGIIIPLGLVTAPRSDIYRYLRRSVLEFDGVSSFERRLRRHGFVDVRTEALDGWQKGIVHSFLASKPV